MFLVIKAIISGLLVAAASETAKRFPVWGAIMVSVPLISLLTAIWMNFETKDTEQVAAFLKGVFWAHLPTLVFFLLCPSLLRSGMSFWPAMLLSMAATIIVFFVYAMILRQFGIDVIGKI